MTCPVQDWSPSFQDRARACQTQGQRLRGNEPTNTLRYHRSSLTVMIEKDERIRLKK